MIKLRNIDVGYAPHRKHSAVGAAAITGAAALGSAIWNGISQGNSDFTNAQIAYLNAQMQERTNYYNWWMNRENNIANMQLAAQNNEANKQIADQFNANQVELQNDMNSFNKEMWDLNNQYNTPAAQLERAKAAGINPNSALGIAGNISNSPVQQLSAPAQQMARNSVIPNQAASAVAPQFRYTQRDKRYMDELLSFLKDIPEYDLKIKGMKEDVRAKRLANDEKEDSNKQYKNVAFIQNPDDPFDVITQYEYDSLSDDDKKRYQDPSVSSDVLLPNNMNLSFDSKAGYDAYVDMLNLRRNISDLGTDISQIKLKRAVADGQLKNTSVIEALIDMPSQEYNLLKQNVSKAEQEVQKEKDYNKDSKLRHDYLEKTVKHLDNIIQEEENTSLYKFIEKVTGDGEMSLSDWLKGVVLVLCKATRR